jgi:hypothetical protein
MNLPAGNSIVMSETLWLEEDSFRLLCTAEDDSLILVCPRGNWREMLLRFCSRNGVGHQNRSRCFDLDNKFVTKRGRILRYCRNRLGIVVVDVVVVVNEFLRHANKYLCNCTPRSLCNSFSPYMDKLLNFDLIQIVRR